MADTGHQGRNAHEPMLISRRLIYLNRLVGDNYITSAAKPQRRNPWRVSIIFIVYVAITTDWVVKEVRSEYVSSINNAVQVRLETTPYRVSNGAEWRYNNITTMGDVQMYLLFGLYPEFLMADPQYAEPTSFLSYNRPLPNEDLCHNVSSLYVTMRAVKTTPTADRTSQKVSERFESIYPTTWMAPDVESGSPPTDNEKKEDLPGTYLYSDFLLPPPITLPPETKMGTTREGTPLRHETLPRGTPVHVTWKYQQRIRRDAEEGGCTYCHGYHNQGGYVALLSMQNKPEYQALVDRMRANGALELDYAVLQAVVQDNLVFLLDEHAEPYTDSSHGVCGQVRASNIIRLGDFTSMLSSIPDTSFVSVAVNLQFYNANKQTLTDVSLTWNANAAGIVFESKIDLKTLCLDQEYYVVQLLIFAVMTAYYALDMVIYRGYKQRAGCKMLKDPWVYMDALCIILSLAAISLRVALGSELEEFLKNTENSLPSSKKITDLCLTQSWFASVSSLVVLTMFCRMVEVLSKTPFRVTVLEHTLRKAVPDMLKYGAYMFIVMLSFVAFTVLHFSQFSADFRDAPRAIVSCVEMLLLSTRPYNSVRQAFWSLPFLFIYFMFAIISVQMFNAIINYSYNRKCEDMEPIYLKQLRDRQIRESQAGPRRSPLLEALVKFLGKCRRCCSDKKKGSGKEANEETVEKKKGSREEDLTPAEREQVDKAREQIARRPKPDKAASILFYTIFVITYNLFLFDNLDVRVNGKIMTAIRQSVLNANVRQTHATGEKFGLYFEDTSTIQDVASWMTHALPEMLQGEPGEATEAGDAQDQYFIDHGMLCIKAWNCVLQLPENATSERKQMVRITQRLQRRIENRGVTSASASSTRGFLGGPAILPLRGPSEYLSPTDGPDPDWEDVTSDMNLRIVGGHDFCKRESSGGYHDNGGIVCLLDTNIGTLRNQLVTMFEQGFYSMNTSAIIVEFATYNGNSDNLAYTRITFQLHPTGYVEKELYVYALRLIKIYRFSEGMSIPDKINQVLKTAIQLRLLWGILYMLFLLISIIKMIYEVKIEMQQCKDNAWSKFGACVKYFTTDVYHTLDLISFAICTVSIIIFLVWFSHQINFVSETTQFSTFMTYVDLLASVGKLYSSLSAVTVLLTTWRYLKYLRVVPQVRIIYDTLYQATPDILWFVCMLIMFFMGFAMLAHINFGARVLALNTVGSSIIYCFKYLIGEFSFWELSAISPWLAVAFFFPYLFIFNLFYLNVFFAIMDKNFANKEGSGYFSFRKFLKPMLGRVPCLRWIQWDDDLSMEEDPTKNPEKRQGPPSRAGRVREKAREIREILESGIDVAGGSGGKKAKSLGEVIDKDDRIDEALRWTRDEARRFIQAYKRLLLDKEDAKNEESFINKTVRKRINKDLDEAKEGMEEAERLKKYAIHVHEKMAMKDQETLALYICCLEQKIRSVATKKRIELADLYHLTAEAEKMRYTDEELWQLDGQATKGVQQAVSLPSMVEEGVAAQDVVVEAADQPRSADQVQAQEESHEPQDAQKNAGVKLRMTAAELNDQLAEFIED